MATRRPGLERAGLERAGLFGGSFDPVHDAHLALARAALGQLGLDEVRWVPAGQPWQKARALTSPADREAMVRLAIAGEPRFVLDRIELARAGVSYTLDTVRSLAAASPGTRWFLLIGQDQYATFETWHGWRELLGLVTLAVAGRPGTSPAANAALGDTPCVHVALPPMQVSATEIRHRIEAGRGIDDLVPAAVARYIEQHRLYIP